MNKSHVAKVINDQIKLLGKKQDLIAQEAGFNSPNIITMIKQAKTKLPLAKVGLLAKALELDPAYLLKLCIEEYQPDTWVAIRPYMEHLLTEDEFEMVLAFRNSIGAPYISALSVDQRMKMNHFLQSMNNDVCTFQ